MQDEDMLGYYDEDSLYRNAAVDAAWGAAAGLIFGGLMVLVGVGRFVQAGLAGSAVAIPDSGDAQFVGVYLATFTLGGAFLGFASPWLQSSAAKILAGIVIGAAGMTIVAVAGRGGTASLDRAGLVAALVVGVVFGGLGGMMATTVGRTPRNRADIDRRLEDIESHVAAIRRARQSAPQRRVERPPSPPRDGTDKPV